MVYTRDYKKLSDAFSQIGGLYTIYLTLITIFANYSLKRGFQKELFNSVADEKKQREMK